MVVELAKTLLECLKLTPRYLVAIAVVCFVLLYGGDKLPPQLGVSQFAENNRASIGIALLGTVALLVGSVGAWVVSSLRNWWRRRRFYRRMKQRLHALTEDEKQILRYYIAKQTRGNTLRTDDGVVRGLVAQGIIYRSASHGNVLEGFAHNICDFAWDYLHVNPHLLDGSTNTYRCDARPGFWSRDLL